VTHLGNRASSLRLQCKACGWPPPADMTVRDAQLHFQVEHDTDQVTMDLVPVCSCGAVMDITRTERTAWNQVRDMLKCAPCGNTGYLLREEVT
jgi:hypothetical protein